MVHDMDQEIKDILKNPSKETTVANNDVGRRGFSAPPPVADAGAENVGMIGKPPLRIAVLVSGGGTNLQALLDAQSTALLRNGEITLVISDRPGAYALTRARKAGVPVLELDRKACGSRAAFEDRLSSALAENRTDLIVLAGFLSILSPDFTARYPRRIINVHPSLIPSFCGAGFYGLKVHEAALQRGVKVTGATVHFVNEIPDGGEILLQQAVEVLPGDTPETLQRRVMEQAEWILLPRSVEQVCKKRKEALMDIYGIRTPEELLENNAYPGRGIVIGKTPDGKHAAIAYFIMGRSENSRNRIFREKDGEVFTEPFDPAKVQDPSLIIYAAVRSWKNFLVVTNGNQTDTVVEGLQAGKSFSEALESRSFEPDGPNWTPRISGLLAFDSGSFTYQMSILKSADAAGSACNRFTYAYAPLNGLGHFLHTYVCDGSPIPTFQGEPERMALCDDIDEMASRLWNALNDQNKISLYVRYVDLETGRAESRLINKHR